MQPEPGLDIGAVPVWYDEEGLHRGNVVEQTPARVQALALVRSGAVYQTPATGEVWFHPWGGDPRIVGHNVIAGPGGDPEGDTAAWFEGSELVIYDTAAGRVVSRTVQPPMLANCIGWCHENLPGGSNFLEVSGERLAWISGTAEDTYSHDVSTGKTSEIEAGVVDVHGDATVLEDYTDNGLVLSTPGRGEERYPHLASTARLSPSGTYVLAVGGPSWTAILNIRTGEVWPLPVHEYPWIAWAYGDTALVATKDQLLACDASQRTCETLPAEDPLVVPTT